MTQVRSILIAGCAAFGVAAATAPAALAAPVAGCNPAFQLRTVASLQEEASDVGDAFILATDENGDGFICNKYLPEPPAAKGLVFDNTKKPR